MDYFLALIGTFFIISFIVNILLVVCNHVEGFFFFNNNKEQIKEQKEQMKKEIEEIEDKHLCAYNTLLDKNNRLKNRNQELHKKLKLYSEMEEIEKAKEKRKQEYINTKSISGSRTAKAKQMIR